MSETSPELVLAAGTVVSENFLGRVQAAAQAGYSGLGLRPEDLTEAIDEGWSIAGLRTLLAEHGLAVVELQSVHGWAGTPEERAKGAAIEAGCYAVADALGAQYMMISNTTLVGDLDEAAEQFALVCRRARERGLQVALEYLPWGPVPDARTAWHIVSTAGEANGGVLVDSWHHFRGAADDDQLRAVPADRILAVQIDDAAAEVVGSLYDDTRNERLNPGEGSFDLVGFVRLLDSMGVSCPYSVEVLSHRQRALPAAVAASESALATRRVLAAARGTDR